MAVLWSNTSGYLDACLRVLVAAGAKVLLICDENADRSAPFEINPVNYDTVRVDLRGRSSYGTLCKHLQEFRPDVLLINSWHVTNYRRLARHYAGRALRILAMDNQWLGTPKQRLGVLTAPVYLQPAYDVAWVPGERQVDFARRLGFSPSAVLTGLYSADTDAFFRGPETVEEACDRYVAEHFLFVGRLVPEKGVRELLLAYERYRGLVAEPWPLVVLGTGPLWDEVNAATGVRALGFRQPSETPALMRAAACLVLPSLFEPWGVVLHEAASAGLPVIASPHVGATVHLLRPCYNGFLVEPYKTEVFAQLLREFSSLSCQQREMWSSNSRALAAQYSPELWTNTLLRAYSGWLSDRLVAG